MKSSLNEIILEISKGTLSPLELTDKILTRIDQFDSTLKSCLGRNLKVVEEEKRFENQRLKRKSRLKGIPVSIKDLIDTAGIVTTYGSHLYSNHIPKRDARVVTNLKNNGGVVLCKTNTHEFALGIETPPTKNPWDLSRIPGGSSGGSAAALAADLAVFALGTDTGGSIRIPASMCGITGLKPTFGALPVDGIFPEAFSLDHVGPMCRYASDLPLLLEAMGYPRRIERVEKRFIVGLVRTFFDQADFCVSSNVQKFIDKCVSEGFIEVKEVTFPDLDLINRSHSVIDTTEIAYTHRRQFKKSKDDYLSTSVEQIEEGMRVKATDYVSALRLRDKLAAKYSKLFKNVDVIITPTLPVVAPTISEVKRMTLKDHYPYVKFLEAFNYLGFPAITIPSGFCNGLPVGTQLVSRPWRENIIISLASKYQSVTDWHTHVPTNYGELKI
ncbi:MAG: amidase [Thermoplasmatales archaeon]